MVPTVQTFAWWLLQGAHPTCMRACIFVSHIDKKMLQVWSWRKWGTPILPMPFSKDDWFYSLWYLRSEFFATNNHSTHAIMQAILSYGHPNAFTSNLYTFLWCLWKFSNDSVFGRIANEPLQVQTVAKVITQSMWSNDLISSAQLNLYHRLQAFNKVLSNRELWLRNSPSL
jgi:hypothetical protein